MARLIEDLRFVIGAFFAVIGLSLVVEGCWHPPATDLNLNLYTGAVMTAFAAVMIGLALWHYRADGEAESA